MKKKVSLAKRLKLAEARADDATRQMNEAVRLGKGMEELWIEARSELKACRRLHLMAVDDRRSAERRRRELQIEANLWHGKFKDAQMHAKVEYDLLTEAREEITKLKEERRKLERDVLAQRAELAKLQPFNRILGAFPARGPIA